MALDYLLQMIGIIQIALHIPLMGVNVPSNALSFFQTIFPIINYDFLESFDAYNDFVEELSSTKAHKRLLSESFDPQISGQTAALGYDSRNPLVNFGTMALF